MRRDFRNSRIAQGAAEEFAPLQSPARHCACALQVSVKTIVRPKPAITAPRPAQFKSATLCCHRVAATLQTGPKGLFEFSHALVVCPQVGGVGLLRLLRLCLLLLLGLSRLMAAGQQSRGGADRGALARISRHGTDRDTGHRTFDRTATGA